jgi:hypothetical protein
MPTIMVSRNPLRILEAKYRQNFNLGYNLAKTKKLNNEVTMLDDISLERYLNAEFNGNTV